MGDTSVTPAGSAPAATSAAASGTTAGPSGDDTVQDSRPWLRWGRYAWATVGLLLVAVALAWAVGRVSIVVIPLVLALFPAALLAPVARWLREHKVPPALAALLSVLGLFLVIGGVIGGLVPLVVAEAPALADSFSTGVADLEGLLQQLPFTSQLGGIQGLLDTARDQLQGISGQVASGAATVATTAIEFLTGLVLMLFALFFYLKDSTRIVGGVRDLFPRRMQADVQAVLTRVWETVGRYFRGQLLVALIDAIGIGIGLLILGVPLAGPLAVLVFFGGLFPVVGAFIAGTVAVLVALADGGVTTALIVLAIIIGVQQIEGNLLQPFILGSAISLHPLVVIVALTAGGILFGVLGAFLAVPIAASIARAIDYFRERHEGASPQEAVAELEPS